MSEIPKNTLESLIADLIRIQNNSVEIVKKLEEIQVSDNDKVTIDIEDESGNVVTYEVPSMGFFKSEVQRLSQNFDNITGLGARKANIKTADGSIRTVFVAEAPVEPDAISGVAKPLFFFKKNNKIVDSLLNPIPYVRFDMTNKVKVETNRVLVKKVVVQADTIQDRDYFNAELNGSNIGYEDLLTALEQRGLTYREFDEIYNLPPKFAKYSGRFNVINAQKKDVTQIIDDQEITSKKTVYKLNTLLYKDLENDEADVILKQGVKLIVNADIKDTKYIVETVDASTREVTLRRIEGNRAIPVGVDKLMIDPEFIKTIQLEVSVNVDEYLVVFFKPLNPNANIINIDWGDGIGLYTNELVDFDDQTNNTQLVTFYEGFVNDLGKAAAAITADNTIPLAEAIKPDAPLLDLTNMQVVQVNTHKEDVQKIDELRQKFAEKNNVSKEISRLDTAIEKQKVVIATGEFKNDTEKKQAKKELNDLIDERGLKVQEYNTLVSDIVARSNSLSDFSPKYRIRGFFDEVAPKYKDEAQLLGRQDVIQYKYRYRYLRKDNTSPVSEGQEITATDPTQETKKATFSRWVEVVGKIRDRQIDETTTPSEVASAVANPSLDSTKKPTWVDEDPNDPDVVNINQIDIAITQNENVEIQVRSISEAGYPFMVSDWSESIIVQFPDELLDSVAVIGQTSTQEQLRAQFLQELNAIQLPEHLADQVTIGDKFFAHSGDNLAGPERTPENTPIPINQTITELRNEVENLRAILTGEKGQIKVSITDDLGNVIQDVARNQEVRLFGGFYKDQVADLTTPKGAIVTRLYYLEISNVNPADLELLSYVPGLFTEILPDTDLAPYEGFLSNKTEYENFRRFWQSPLSLRAVTENNDFQTHHDDTAQPFIQLPAFQSSQVKGQLVYTRKRDITLNNVLYDKDVTPANNTLLPITGAGSPETFVWDETQTIGSPNGNGIPTDFCVHVDHPDLVATSDLMTNFTDLYNSSTKLPERSVEPSGDVNYPAFVHAKYFNLQTIDPDGLLQLEYIPYTKELVSGANTENFPKKVGFTKNDQYLIGRNTCGAYLFLAPENHEFLHVGSAVYDKGRIITTGTENSIRIPLIFQYRMTDYYGAGSTGTGIIGGFGTGTVNNLSYAKKIGIDIVIKNQEIFSFDVRVDARYKARSVAELSTVALTS